MKNLHYLMLIIISLMLMKPNSLHAQAFQWATLASNNDAVTKMVTDASGNSYLIGDFQTTVTMGSFSISTYSGASNVYDIFLAKFNSAGTCLWIKTIYCKEKSGGNGNSKAGGIDLDASGNIYITGLVHDTAVIGTTILNCTYVCERFFVAKYDNDGNVVWASQMNEMDNYGSLYSDGRGIAVSSDGSVIYVVGNFNANFEVFNDPIPDTIRTSATDLMVARFNGIGGLMWCRGAGQSVLSADDVAIDADITEGGGAIVTGSVEGGGSGYPIKFDNPWPFVDLSYSVNGTACAFVAHYPDDGIISAGMVEFFQPTPGNYSIGTDIAAGSGSSYYLAGVFTSTMHVGTDSLVSYGGFDAFVMKRSAGGTDWLNHPGGIYSESYDPYTGLGPQIALDASANVYLALSAGDTVHFGSIKKYGGPSDAFVAKINSAGSYDWVTQGGSKNWADYAKGIGVDASGDVYTTGIVDGYYGYFVPNFTGIGLYPYVRAVFLGRINANLHTGAVATALCIGATVSVPFTSGVTMTTGNVYTVQLSDANGLFNSAVTIGTKTSKATSGTITATIPSSATAGSGYRVRVKSSSPSRLGNDNGTDINISAMPDVTVTPPGPVAVCKPATADLYVTSCSGCFYQWYKSSTAQSGATANTYSVAKSGSYKVKVTNSTGCSATSSLVSVTVNPQPTATITPSGTVDICSTGSVVLTANSGAGFSYIWFKGVAALGFDITYTATATGTYKVQVTDANGCTKLSKGTKVIKTCKEGDLMNEETATEISLYPNPVGEKLFVNVSAEASAKEDSYSVIIHFVEVYDELGRKVFGKEISNDESGSEFSIDVSSFNPGVYFIRFLSADGNSSSKKFVKE